MNIKESEVNNYCGLILVDKPAGMTSHKIVSLVRKSLNIDKVGHLGTLDPFATGLLPVLIGGATRLSDEIMDGKKQYLFTIKFGKETDTLDATGRVVDEKDVPRNYTELIKDKLNSFHGEIEQIPPVYSALKMNGKPLYEYMRASGSIPNPIETKKRKIFIQNIEIVDSNNSEETISLRVLCGKGTYVRSLARDLAKAINTVGYCSQLRREFVEPWHVENAISVPADIDKEELKNEIKANLIPVTEILNSIPIIELDECYSKQISSGNIVLLERNNSFISEHLFQRNNFFSAFVKVKNFEVMFYSEIKFLIEFNLIKIMPKKKMY
nr:tRNA pseudouridine(55) synthase TruB [Pigmentibacter ruber]